MLQRSALALLLASFSLLPLSFQVAPRMHGWTVTFSCWCNVRVFEKSRVLSKSIEIEVGDHSDDLYS
jgi:hypothetical protein